ncbi:MAG: hypothetical protein M3Y55_17360, partial [Pseudomonadota bacterium]|nr:hypothetical protein [Pseudomonadota bacterium]
PWTREMDRAENGLHLSLSIVLDRIPSATALADSMQPADLVGLGRGDSLLQRLHDLPTVTQQLRLY